MAKRKPEPGTERPIGAVSVFENENLSSDDQNYTNAWWKEMIAMQNLRGRYEPMFKRCERQFDSQIADLRDDVRRSAVQMAQQQMGATVRLQVDRNNLEQHIGEEGFKLPYKVIPIGKNADSTALEIGKYTLDFFVRTEDVVGEIVDFRWDRGIYGTGFLDSSIWLTRTVNNVPKEGDFQATEFEEEISLHYHIGLRNVSVWDVWFDERATKWKDVRRCVRRQKMDIEEFRATYSGKPGFNYVDSVIPVWQDWYSPEEVNKDKVFSIDARNVYLFHTYNETTGEYVIMANRRWPIYRGKVVYRDSKIPITASQMYKRSNSIYGMPMGDKSQSFLAYMNDLTGMLLDKVAIASMPPLVVGNNGQIDGEIYSGGNELPVLNFNGDAGQVQQLRFDSNVEPHVQAIDFGRNEIIMNTGVNPLDYNKPLSGINPFVAGLQEQSKKAKMALSNAMFDMAVGEAFSKMLDNIVRFGPSLYGKTFDRIVDGQAMEDVEWLSIQVPNKKIVGKGSKIRFEDAPGEFGYFDMTKDLFKDKKNGNHYEMAVAVVTPTTQTLLDSLRKDDFNQLVSNLAQFRNMFPDQPLPVEPQELWEMMGEVYGYDVDKIQGTTETKKRRQQAAELIEGLRNMNPANITGQNGAPPALNAPNPVEMGMAAWKPAQWAGNGPQIAPQVPAANALNPM